MVLAARDQRPPIDLAARLGNPDRTLPISCDVTGWARASGLVTRLLDTWGRLDLVFANAGASVVTSFLGNPGAPPEQWGDMVLANVHGPALTARAALPALVASGGHLVLTGSAGGARPGSLYSATKWAVTGLAQAERVGTAVRVTLVQPGLVDIGGIPPERSHGPKLDPDETSPARSSTRSANPTTVDVHEVLIRPVGQDPYR